MSIIISKIIKIFSLQFIHPGMKIIDMWGVSGEHDPVVLKILYCEEKKYMNQENKHKTGAISLVNKTWNSNIFRLIVFIFFFLGYRTNVAKRGNLSQTRKDAFQYLFFYFFSGHYTCFYPSTERRIWFWSWNSPDNFWVHGSGKREKTKSFILPTVARILLFPRLKPHFRIRALHCPVPVCDLDMTMPLLNLEQVIQSAHRRACDSRIGDVCTIRRSFGNRWCYQGLDFFFDRFMSYFLA